MNRTPTILAGGSTCSWPPACKFPPILSLDYAILADKQSMEKRREPRVPVDSFARVTVLGESPRMIDGRVVNASGRGMRLLLDSPLPVGAPVQVDLGGVTLLGEVCYAVPELRGYAVGLELDQMLAGLSELAHQVDTLLEAPRLAPARRK